MSSTCRSRRSTKSIPGILLPRSCLAQSVAAHKGRQRVRQQRVKRRNGGRWTVWSDAAIDRLQFMDSCSQFKCNCSRTCSWSRLSHSLPLSPLSPGAHELATPPHNGPQAQAKSRARARVGVDQADTHSALEIGKLFSLLQWRSSGSGSS